MDYLNRLDDIIKEVEESLEKRKMDVSFSEHPRTGKKTFKRAGRYTIREFGPGQNEKDVNEESSDILDNLSGSKQEGNRQTSLDGVEEQQNNTHVYNGQKMTQVGSSNDDIAKDKLILNISVREAIEDSIVHFYSDPMSENMLETVDVSSSDTESIRSDTNYKSRKTRVLPLKYAIIKKLKNRKMESSEDAKDEIPSQSNKTPKFDHKNFSYFKYPENISFKTHKSEKISSHLPKTCSILYKTGGHFISSPKMQFKLCTIENIGGLPARLENQQENKKKTDLEDHHGDLYKKSNWMKLKKMHASYKTRCLKIIEKVAYGTYDEFERANGGVAEYQDEIKNGELTSENALKFLVMNLKNDAIIFDNITKNFCKYCPALEIESKEKTSAVRDSLQSKSNMIEKCLNDESQNKLDADEEDLAKIKSSESSIQAEDVLPGIDLFDGDKSLKSEVLMRFEKNIIKCLLSLSKSDISDIIKKYREFTPKKQDLSRIEHILNDKAFRNYLGAKVAKNIQASEIKMVIDRFEKYKDFIEEVLKIINRGNVDMDLRFIDMISRSIKKLQGSDDPFTCKMVVQAVLCRKYVEDSVELKKLFKKFSTLDI